ncbi:MAG: sugar ABC transporter substrate-binding protein [Phycicoccus sp.]|nr:sugar ABC transporter substrate-binding protein [Phycicoccus sp.]
MSRTKARVIALAALTPLLAVAACSSGSDGDSASSGGSQIDYWLWDANQQPAYQKCADAFATANPGSTVKITQRGWDDYWSTLTTGFQSDTAPDVFTDHLSKYPEFVANKVILPLDDVVTDIDTTQYADGLADLWVAQDGKRYGLPKDWDTIALFYNKKMVADAGLTEDEMQNLTWNPADGGTYEDVIAKLTVDANGVHGDQPGFDKSNVAVYGLGLPGAGAGNGQTEWSYFTETTGWSHTDKNPWGTSYNYDDSRFQDSIAWWKSLIDKGLMPPLEQTVGASMNDNFGAGKSAINANGSWMIGSYTSYDGVELGIAPTPVGPSGERASMFNGLADSIYAGTDNKELAGKWVAFLGSAECQSIVAKEGVVFPAITSAVAEATTAFQAKGVDVTAFTMQVDDGTTFLFPITDHAADINAIMQPAMDGVLSGANPVDSLTAANDQVNALFK